MVQLLKFRATKLSLAIVLITICVTGLPIVFAQEAKLEMRLIGYGKTYRDVRISFKNVGNITISDITIYIDGNAYKTIEGSSGPDIIFEEAFYLEPGKHLIEARTPEGAYASLDVTASGGEVPKPTVASTTKPTTSITEQGEIKFNILESIKKNILWIVLTLSILVFVISVWLMKRSPEQR